MKKSRPFKYMSILCKGALWLGPTDDEALHLVLAQNINTEGIPDFVVEFVGTSAGGHDG